MDRLQQRFDDRIDFFHIDVDAQETRPVRQRFDIRGHTQYVLIDADGNVLSRWISYLDEETIAAEIEELLATLELAGS